jgi:hypothetical protein
MLWKVGKLKEWCFSGLIVSSVAFPSVELVVDVAKTLLGFLRDMKSSSSDEVWITCFSGIVLPATFDWILSLTKRVLCEDDEVEVV